MKIVLKLIIIICLFILIVENDSLGIGRLVDIPVPENNFGNADFSLEDGKQRENEYKEQLERNNVTAEEYIGKSNNNYLKKLEVEGYKIEPQFDSKVNNYILRINANTKINIMAEPENEISKIEGIGEYDISNEENILNINVIAENGNLNVYTINIVRENKNIEKDTEGEAEINIIDTESLKNSTKELMENKENIKIPIIIFIIVLVNIVIMILKNKGKGKHNK